MYDAVVVIGSGFKIPEDDGLDTYGMKRIEKAVELFREGHAEHIIITGNGTHPKTNAFFYHKAWKIVIGLGVHPSSVSWASDIGAFSTDTLGDVKQAIAVARRQRWQRLIVVTEKPHWFFRVCLFFRREAPDLKIQGWQTALTAPWWYWCKECLSGIALRLPQKIRNPIYRFMNEKWHQISHLFSLYSVRR